MSYITKATGLVVGVAVLATVVEASAVCPGISVQGEAFSAGHRANQVCVAANAQAGSHLTYSTIGEVYNNNTSGTTQSMCDLPGIAGHFVSDVGAIVEKKDGGDSGQPTACTLRAFNSDGSIVYSDSASATACNVALQITPPSNTTFAGANVRCSLNAKLGSSVASISGIREAYWVN